jgi:hypothetical protein
VIKQHFPEVEGRNLGQTDGQVFLGMLHELGFQARNITISQPLAIETF